MQWRRILDVLYTVAGVTEEIERERERLREGRATVYGWYYLVDVVVEANQSYWKNLSG